MGKEGIRDAIKKYSPPWLQDGVAEKILYVAGICIDGFIESLNQGLKARMPGEGTDTALPLIGRDRNIERGRSEPDASYAARLSRAFPTWRTAGSPWAILRQLRAYLQLARTVKTVSNTGVWHTLSGTAKTDTDGEYTVDRLYSTGSWNWDGLTTRWWRGWVIIYCDSSLPWGSDGTWGDGTDPWGDGGTWGTTATVEEVQSVQALVRKWKPQHAIVPNIIIVLENDSAFDPITATVLPDGHYDDPSHRSSVARYWDGV